MKWQPMADTKIMFLDAEPAMNLIVEATYKKNGSGIIRGYIDDRLMYGPRSFSTTAAVKRDGEKWFKQTLKNKADSILQMLRGCHE